MNANFLPKKALLLAIVFGLLMPIASFAVDTDNDGVDDSVDAFPADIEASVDTDGDGKPDAFTAVVGDDFEASILSGLWSSSGETTPGEYQGEVCTPYGHYENVTIQGWEIASGNAYASTYAARTNVPIAIGQTAILSDSVVTGTTISFNYLTNIGSSSTLSFWLDGVQQASWSGFTAWGTYTIPVSAGNHFLEWRYYKADSGGNDRALIDNVNVGTELIDFEDQAWGSGTFYLFRNQVWNGQTSWVEDGSTCTPVYGPTTVHSQPWSVVSNVQHDGTYAVRSGATNDTYQSTLDIDVVTKNQVSFYYKTSTQSSADYLKFLVDDVEVFSASGDQDWQQHVETVTPGAHNLKWI
ncbi:MAG: hypothetical protein KDI30_11240, partial [Pseudomonadales bacterium]|nr:hypothetical protein [Pseudomonadales bacterium]